MRTALILFFLLFSVAGCISRPSEKIVDSPIIENGDTVVINYIERVKDTNELVATSYSDLARDPAIQKAMGYVEAEQYGPINITVGSGTLPAVEDALVGMRIGEEKEVLIPSREAYGERLSELIRVIPRVAILPRIIEVPLTEFEKTPTVDSYVQLRYWRARVIEVTNESIALRNEPEEGSVIQTIYGPAQVKTNTTHVMTILNPVAGSFVDTPFGLARIASYDDDTVTLDHNHPLAGKSLTFTFKIEGIEKLK